MKLRVLTESGSCHEVEGLTYRRLQVPVDPSPESIRLDLRRDGDDLRLLAPPADPVIGEPWTLLLAPLAQGADITVRTTTFVVSVETFDEQ